MNRLTPSLVLNISQSSSDQRTFVQAGHLPAAPHRGFPVYLVSVSEALAGYLVRSLVYLYVISVSEGAEWHICLSFWEVALHMRHLTPNNHVQLDISYSIIILNLFAA
jgi:hypothetical protein